MRILFVIIILAIVVVLAWNLYEHFTGDCEICAFCGEKIVWEGTQLREFWVHDKCWSNLAKEYGWYEESSVKVIDKICEELERRNEI